MSTSSDSDSMIQSRVLTLTKLKTSGSGPVVYLCSRDQRTQDNAALSYAQHLAQYHNRQLLVVFRLIKAVSHRALQHYQFMLQGLQELEQALTKQGVGFMLVQADVNHLVSTLSEIDPAELVCDFSPLRGPRTLQKQLKNRLDIPVHVVDAHNSVPVWVTSQKEEYAARTIRPKIHQHLDLYLSERYNLKKQIPEMTTPETDWTQAEQYVAAKRARELSIDFLPGEQAAHKALDQFIKQRLAEYAELRNDPAQAHLSDLSPYLHFGMLSAADAARAARESDAPQVDIDAFIEELIVRKELSDNFCFYNPDYDSLTGAKEWARETLQEHEADPRDYEYTLDQLRNAQTHDEAWNAAQRQMRTTGKMHGYMRMYWAKKILEWSPNAKTAIKRAITLNDGYSIDGYDPNGYTGIMWSIAGIHDRGWTERDIFGKIRFMNFKGLKRKFDIQTYIETWRPNR